MIKHSIFEEQIARKPDHYPWTKKFRKAMHDGLWTDDKFKFTSDVQDFKVHFNDQERLMTTRSLSSVSQVEVAVKTYWGDLGHKLPHPSIRDMGYVMADIEVIHNEAYERLLRELGIEEIFEENLKTDVIGNRVKYLRKYLHKHYKDAKKQLVYSLILFTLYVENVSLFSQFYTINYFNRFHNRLKDVSQMVAYTAKEETLHALAGMYLVNVIREEEPELFDDELVERIRHECEESYKAECKISEWCLNGYESEHLSLPIVQEFLKQRFNESLVGIQIKPVFENIDKKLLAKTQWFKEDVIGPIKTDFFYKRPTEYAHHGSSRLSEDLF